jgi:methionyl-tRNA formyltransferase
MTYIFCAYREWSLMLYKKLKKRYKNMILITKPSELTYNYLKKLNPKYIFLPDWSWIIPKKITDEFTCVCFHESDLPRFRGGSPLQNQIIRNLKKTKTSAFIMTDHLDDGDILLKHNLSLEGNLDDIFERMIKNDYDMIIKIIAGKFKRRKPSESELKTLNHSKTYLHNFIRMLSDPYPNAFLKIGNRKIIFKSSSFNGKSLKFYGEII